jgi:hypothetical protein
MYKDAVANLPPKPVTSAYPIRKADISTNNDNNKSSIDNIKLIIFGMNCVMKSIATNPPLLKAVGAINPVIHNMQNLAASSGQGSALFKI